MVGSMGAAVIVSTTVPAEGTTCPVFMPFADAGFNYRARGGHDGTVNVGAPVYAVSTTVPAEGTTQPPPAPLAAFTFQLPCPRRARRNNCFIW